MSLLNSAIAAGRWDLAAHTIIYVLAKKINDGEKADAGKTEKTRNQEKIRTCENSGC